MLEELAAIDTTAIEQLAGLSQEQSVLQGRLAKMEEMRDKVSDAVFQKVHEDYGTRLAALEDQCRPLRRAALTEYRTLSTIYTVLEESLEAARLDKEELEFRFTLGEFPESAFKEQLGEKDTTLAERRSQIEEAGTVRQSFLDVLGPEDELDLNGDDDDAEQGEEEAEDGEDSEESDDDDDEYDEEESSDEEEEPDDDQDSEDDEDSEGSDDEDEAEENGGTTATSSDDEEWEDEAPTDEHPVVDGEAEDGSLEPLPPSPIDEEATHVANPDQPADPTATEVVPPPVPGATDDPRDDATVIITRPRLIVMEGGVAIDEFVLGMGTTSIGRGPENVIVLNDDSVSRQHAAVVPTVDGFAICDLRSENGTYVNNERTQEQTLAHGDLVHVGTRTLIFRQR